MNDADHQKFLEQLRKENAELDDIVKMVEQQRANQNYTHYNAEPQVHIQPHHDQHHGHHTGESHHHNGCCVIS